MHDVKIKRICVLPAEIMKSPLCYILPPVDIWGAYHFAKKSGNFFYKFIAELAISIIF